MQRTRRDLETSHRKRVQQLVHNSMDIQANLPILFRDLKAACGDTVQRVGQLRMEIATAERESREVGSEASPRIQNSDSLACGLP